MTLEEMQKRMKELEDKQQNDFIDKLSDMIDHFIEKVSKKDYEPTPHEKKVFFQIYTNILSKCGKLL